MRLSVKIASVVLGIGVIPAFAADLPSRKAPPPPPILSPAPVWSWNGLYVGLNAGGFINDTKLTTAVASGTETGGGALVGGTLGYNWQFANNFVLGVETDIGYRSAPTVSTGFTASSATRDGYFGTARARLGMTFDRALLYATGGLAYGNAIAPNALLMPGFGYFGARSGNNGGTMVGWTVGAGAEYAITDRVSLKAEYLYADLGKKTLAYVDPFSGLPTGLVPTDVRTHTIRAGVNYRFDLFGAAGPIVARY